MEHITSRKNRIAAHLKALGSERSYRREQNSFLCDGEKLLDEALDYGARIDCVLWSEKATRTLQDGVEQYTCPIDLLQYISPLKNSRGPLFSVRLGEKGSAEGIKNALVLENVQDPGNVGTVIRTAAAMGVSAVILLGDCADVYNPKTVRSTMGAIFRQRIIEADYSQLEQILADNSLTLVGAALSGAAKDIRTLDLSSAAVAVGSEGSGLTKALLDMCQTQLMIPMEPNSESLNAAIAASIIMWQMYSNRREG